MLSILFFIQKLPIAKPNIKALNIISKECNVVPKTKFNILIQVISYMKDANPVHAATNSSKRYEILTLPVLNRFTDLGVVT